jgi:hypothetical protein
LQNMQQYALKNQLNLRPLSEPTLHGLLKIKCFRQGLFPGGKFNYDPYRWLYNS